MDQEINRNKIQKTCCEMNLKITGKRAGKRIGKAIMLYIIFLYCFRKYFPYILTVNSNKMI